VDAVRLRITSTKSVCLGISAIALATALAACGSGGSNTSSSASPHAGGTLTALVGVGYNGDWPAGLDPATNTNGAADQDQMSSIFGQLFQLGAGGKIIPDLATGYTVSAGGKTFTITLRKGVKFTDGTPFNAQAVAWNWNRDLKSPCTCKPTWPITSVTAQGDSAIVVNLSSPYGALINTIYVSNVNWIASPTAYQKMGAKAFSLKPVGAGPFIVVSDTLNSQLVLKRNPDYWQKGRPYLDKLIFKSVGGGDEGAYEAMLAGEGQVYENMSTPALLKQAKQHFTVTNNLSTSPYDLQLNTAIAPFNNILAREAIYYATDFKPILQHIFSNLYPEVQGFTGPGGLCYSPTVPGYRGYDLAKAKALVKQVGGINIDLGTINILVAKETTEALQTEWAKAGIKTTLHAYDLATLIRTFTSKKWQAMIQTAGAYDPAAGVGVGFRFSSMSPFTGVHDPKLDAMINSAAAGLDLTTRCKIYDQIAKYISDQAYGPFYFAFAPANIVAKGVTGPGLTSVLPTVAVVPTIPWEDVSAASSS
jgi:peptide/nickel transport system substrate-binding protein